MKKIVLLMALVFLYFNSMSQNTFFRFVGGWRSLHVKEFESTFCVCSVSMNSNYDNFTYIETVSEDADSLSSFSLSLDTVGYEFKFNNSFAEGNTSNYVASYFRETTPERFRGLLVKYNHDYTDTLSTRLLDIGQDGSILQLCSFKNDTSLILGSFSKSGNMIYTSFLETDTLGQIRWQKDFHCGGGCRMRPFHILPTEDNGFIFTCIEEHWNGESDIVDLQTALIKTDSVGNTLWQHTWGGDSTKNEGSWVVPLDDGNFLYAWTDNDLIGWHAQANSERTIRFAKFDIDGNVIWYKDLSNNIQDKWYRITQMELMPDGNIILGIEGYLEGALVKIDQEANLIWYRELMPPGLSLEENTASYQYMKILGLTCTSDGGFILSGEYLSYPGNIFPDLFQSAYVYKLDEYGCYEPGCHVGVEEQPKQSLTVTPNTLKLYPNPAKDYFTVEYSFASKDKPIVLKVTDVQGKEFYAKELQYTQDQLVIDVGNYSSGTYYVSLFAGKHLIKSQSIQVNK